MGGGGGKGGSTPDAPDYQAIAIEQGKQDRKTAQEVTKWNRPTQNNPFGQISWEQDAEGNWTQNETWDPSITKGYEQAQQLKDKAYGDLLQQGDFKAPGIPEYDEAYRKQYEEDMYNSVMDRARPEQERTMDQFTTKLRQQGLQPGTEAYDVAMQNLMTSQGDVNTQAALQARMAGGQEARSEYDTALRGQNQAYSQADANYGRAWDTAGAANNLFNTQYSPSFSGFSGATGYQPADMMGAAQAQYQADMGQYSAGQSQKGGLMNAGAGMMGGMMGGK